MIHLNKAAKWSKIQDHLWFASFDRSLFLQKLHLDGAIFKKRLSFHKSLFVGSFLALLIQEIGEMWLNQCIMRDEVDLNHGNFQKGLQFINSTCERNVNFNEAEFGQSTSFTKLKIAGSFNGREMKFVEEVLFRDCEIANEASFKGSTFAKK